MASSKESWLFQVTDLNSCNGYMEEGNVMSLLCRETIFVFNVKNRKEGSLRSWHEEKEPFAAAYTEGAVRRVMDPLRPEPQDHARLLGHSYQACKQVLTISGKFSYYCCSVAKSL